MRIYLSMWKTEGDFFWVLGVDTKPIEKEEGRKIMFSTEEEIRVSGIEETLKRGMINIIKIASVQNKIEREKIIMDISPDVPFPEDFKRTGNLILCESIW